MELKPFNGTLDAAPSLIPFTGKLDGEVETPTPSRLRRVVADPALSLLKGAIAVPEAVVGIADIATGGYAGKLAEKAGFKPKEAKSIIDTLYTPEQQQLNREVANTEGFFPTIAAAVQRPSTIAHSVLESAPGMIGAGGVARGIMKVAPKAALAAAGEFAPIVAGAAGEGVFGAGSAAEQIRQETPTGLLTPKQAALAAASGVGTAAFGLAGGGLARKMGIADVDTMIAGGKLAGQSKVGMVKGITGGMLSEGIFEELPQSAQEQVMQNLALGKPWDERVAESAALGGLAGAAMGGGGQVLSHAGDYLEQRGQQPQIPTEEANAVNQQNQPATEIVTGANVRTGNILQDSSGVGADSIPESWPVDSGRDLGIAATPPAGAMTRAVNSILPDLPPISADMYSSFAAQPFANAPEIQPEAASLPSAPSELEKAMAWKNQQSDGHLMQLHGERAASYASRIVSEFRKSQEKVNGITSILPEVPNQGPSEMDGQRVAVPPVQSQVAGVGSDNIQPGGVSNDLSSVQQKNNGPQEEVSSVRSQAVTDRVTALKQEKEQLLTKNSGKGITGGLVYPAEVTQRLSEINAEIQAAESGKAVNTTPKMEEQVAEQTRYTVPDPKRPQAVPFFDFKIGKAADGEYYANAGYNTAYSGHGGPHPPLTPSGHNKGYGTEREALLAAASEVRSNIEKATNPQGEKYDTSKYIKELDKFLGGLPPENKTGKTPPPVKPANTRRQLDTSKDSIAVAIAKLGGISRTEIDKQTGTGKDLAHTLNSLATKEAKAGILHVISSKGIPLDRMREALVEQGYLDESADINTLLDKLDSAQRGTVHRSTHSTEAGTDAYREAEIRYSEMINAMTDEEYDEFSRNQWLDEQVQELADAGDILDEYLDGLDNETLTAADWQEVENDLKEVLDATEFSQGNSTEDQGQVQEDATSEAESVSPVSKGDVASEGTAGAVKTVERLPLPGKKEHPRGKAGQKAYEAMLNKYDLWDAPSWDRNDFDKMFYANYHAGWQDHGQPMLDQTQHTETANEAYAAGLVDGAKAEKPKKTNAPRKARIKAEELPTATKTIEDEINSLSLEEMAAMFDDVTAAEKPARSLSKAKKHEAYLKQVIAKAKPENKPRIQKALQKHKAKQEERKSTPPPIDSHPTKPERDDQTAPYFKEGDRVQDSDGKHGEVSRAETFISRMITYGSASSEASQRHSHSYDVVWDNGVKGYASFDHMNHETDPAPAVVPAPVYNKVAVEPDALLRNVAYSRKQAQSSRNAAERAKKKENIASHEKSATAFDKTADEQQAAFDTWAEKYPDEADKYRQKVEAAKPKVEPVAGMKVSFNSAQNGIELRFEGKPSDAVISKIKAEGFRWAMRKRVWYVTDTPARRKFVEGLQGEAVAPEKVELADNEVQVDNNPYIYTKVDGDWYHRSVGGTAPGNKFSPPFDFLDKLNTALAGKSVVDVVAESIPVKSVDNSPYEKEKRGKAIDAAWSMATKFINNGQGTDEYYNVFKKDLEVYVWDYYALSPEDLESAIKEIGGYAGLFDLWSKQTARSAKPAINSTIDYEAWWDNELTLVGRRVITQDMSGQTDLLAKTKWRHLTDTRKKYLVDTIYGTGNDPIVSGAYGQDAVTGTPATDTRGASDILKAAADSGVKGAGEALKGLYDIFGGGSLKNFPGAVDEHTYAKAKPHFVAAYNNFKESGKQLTEFFQFIAKQFGNAIKPYLMRFMDDVKNNNYAIIEENEEVSDVNSERQKTGTDDSIVDEGTGTSDAQRSDKSGDVADVPGRVRSGDGGVVSVSVSSSINENQQDPRFDAASAGDGTSATRDLGSDPSGLSGILRSDATGDLRIPNGGLERTGSWKDSASRNLDIVELIKTLREENRMATPDEQLLLMKYVGWGSGEIRNKIFPGYAEQGRIIPQWAEAAWKPLVDRLDTALTPEELKTAARSSQYAHYTSEAITRSMWKAFERMGFAGGKVFEPGPGTGNFMGTMPDGIYANSKYTGIEMDGITAAIAQQLYPNQNIIHGDYTKQKFPGNFFDVAIGNPPFSSTTILTDPDYKKNKFSLHDFFFAKTIDKVRPGGLLAFVTSRYTMDKLDDKARAYLSERADLLGAIRLPQTAFKQHSGTEVVTDVIFLRKRAEGEAPALSGVEGGGHAWGKTADIQIGDQTKQINEYFAAHPEMVLGTHVTERGQFSQNDYSVKPLEGDIEQLFAAAVQNLPANVYSAMRQDPKTIKQVVVERDFSPKNKKEGGVYLSDKSGIMRVENGSGVSLSSMVKLSAKEQVWLTDYIPLRDLMKQARFDQFNDAGWEKSLKELNKAYDAFVKKHGNIKDFTLKVKTELDEDGNEQKVESRNYKWEKTANIDVEGSLVLALEQINDDGDISKASFLTGRTVMKPVRSTNPQSMGDALALSLDEIGMLDLDHIAGLMKMSRTEAIEALGDMIYETPSGEHLLADEYLSGDVVTKLAEAEQAARSDEKFRANVKALTEVQPKPLTPGQITAGLGMAWMPTDIVGEFAQEVLNLNIKVERHAATNTWKVTMGNAPAKGYGRRASSKKQGVQSLRSSTAEWGTADRGANEILDAVLNQRPLRITVRDLDGKVSADPAATARVNEIADNMRTEFRSWIWTDAERAGEMLDLYNKKYNNLAPRRFDGSHLTLPGIATKYKLHPHQKRAIWRMIQTGNTYLAHAVGAGKTLEMIAAGMEMKRLGLINKPLYVVPNDQLSQWSAEFMDAYPLASIMVADELNFDLKNRKRFMAQAAMNAPDAIIITQSALGKLRMKPESVAPVKEKMLNAMREALTEAQDDDAPRHLISKMEKMIENAEQRFDSIVEDGKGDNIITYEELGVDFLFVDEAHKFRKLDFTTVQQVKGIDPVGSRTALDLFLKTNWMEHQKPGRSHVFASGTPVTNTMGELYNVMRFFMEEEMERDDIGHFDAWAAMFGQTAMDYELNAAGKYEPVSRFAKFNNLPELMKRVRTFMDVLTSSHLGAYVVRPDIKGGKPNMIIATPSDELKAYQTNVLQPRMQRARDWKPTPDQPGNPDPIINIITDGRLSSIDMRLVGSTKNDPDSKLNRVIDEIIRVYKDTKDNKYNGVDGKPSAIKGGTQVVFYNHGFGANVAKSRGFDARAWINQRLKAAGIPAGEVAWFDEYDTSAKQLSVMKDMREGRKKIIIGHANSLGVGKNLQTRLYALHYIDPPWYPSAVEQAHGRIIRQGNQNTEIEANWYSTKGSYDSTMWQMVGRKGRFIEQAFMGDDNLRTMEDVSEVSQYEMARALSSGDERVIKLVGLQADIERYSRLKEAHFQQQSQMRGDKNTAEWNISYEQKSIAKLKEAVKAVGGYVSGSSFKGVVEKRTIDKAGEFGEAVVAAYNQAVLDLQNQFPDNSYKGVWTDSQQYGSINGMPLVASVAMSAVTTQYSNIIQITDNVPSEIDTNMMMYPQGTDGAGLARRIFNRLNDVSDSLRRTESNLAEDETKLKQLIKRIGAPFEHEAAFNEKIAELSQLQAELTADEVKPGEGPANFALGDMHTDYPYAGRESIEPIKKVDHKTLIPQYIAQVSGLMKDSDHTVKSISGKHGYTEMQVFDKAGKHVLTAKRTFYNDWVSLGEILGKIKLTNGEYSSDGAASKFYDAEAKFLNDHAYTVKSLLVHDASVHLFNKNYMPKNRKIKFGDYVTLYLPESRNVIIYSNSDKAVMDSLHTEAATRIKESDNEIPEYTDEQSEAIVNANNNAVTVKYDSGAARSNASGNQALYAWGDSGLREKDRNKSSLNVPEVQTFVDSLPIAKRVKVWQSPDDLKAADSTAYNQIELAQVNPAHVQAMEYGGTIHVITDNIPNMDRVKALVIGHELAHAGQTKKVVDLAVDWFKRTVNGKTEAAKEAHLMLERIAYRYGYDLTDEKQYRRAVQEATAAIAEQAVNADWKPSGLMQRLFMYIKHWLRQQGLISHVSDSELSLAVAEMLRIGEKRLSVGLGGDEAMFAAAWHGSPHDHNGFSTAHIGTGEGAQAYGYGLYFAGSRDVAEWYKETLARRNKNWQKIAKDSADRAEADYARFKKEFPELAQEFEWNIHEHAPRSIDDRETAIEFSNLVYANSVGKDYRYAEEGFQNKIKDTGFERSPEPAEEEAKGKLYQVELDPKEDEYLLWDMPLNEQSETVKESIQRAFDDIVNNETDYHKASRLSRDYADYAQSNNVNGQQAYNLISKSIAADDSEQNRQRAASEYLHSLGVRGIKYLDGSSRGKGEGNYNYVIFNDADVEITAKFSLQDQAISQHAAKINAPAKVTDMVKSLIELAGQSIPERLKANIGKILSNPWFGSEGKPIRRHVVNLNLERSQNRNGIISDLFQASEGYTGVEGLDNILKKASKEELKQFNDLIKHGDENGVATYFTRDELYRGKTKFGKVGKTVVEAYRAFHEVMNAANRVRFQQLDELSMLPYKDQEWFADLVELLNKNMERAAHLDAKEASEVHRLIRSLKRNLTDDELASGENPAKIKASPAVIAAYRDFWKQVDQTEKKHQGNMLSAFRDILGYRGELDKLKSEWGNLRGYAPRNRKDGDWHVSVYTTNEEGERVKVYMKPTLTETGAKGLVREVQADLKKHLKGNFEAGTKYEVEYERNNATPSELLAWKGSEVAVEALLNQAFDRAGVTGKMSVEQWQSLKHEVFQEIAKEIMAQGFGRHGISRETTLIEGYDDADYQTVLKEYISGMSGWLSKMRFAIETTSAAKDISKANPSDKVWVNDYVQDAMKNSTYLDELAATARSVGAVYYLGFKVSSALLNAFQNYTVGQAELSLIMKKAGHKGSAIAALATAQKDVLKDSVDRKRGGVGTLTKEEYDVLFRAVREGTAQAQAIRQISGTQEMGFGTKWKWFVEKSMTPFQLVEQKLNREPAILAAYRIFKKSAAGTIDEAAYKKAEEFVNNTHYVMGKENLPEMVRKLGPLGKTAYLFQGYVHNYMHWMFNRAKDGEFATIARSLGAIAALGGVFALPGADDMDNWIMKWFGVSYKMKFKKFVKDAAGNSTPGQIIQNFVNHGVTSVVGVDMSRALAVNIPFISDPEKTFGERIGGAWGGLLKKPGMALNALQKGDGLRAIENIVPEFLANPMRAARQYNQGATTLGGKPVFDETGRQVKYSGTDVAKKMLGFNPLEISDRTNLKSDERDLNAYWKSERDDALAGIRRAKNSEDMKAAVRGVVKYNTELRKSQAFGLVPIIKAESIQKSRTFKPQKKTMAWERNQIE
jgi:N12 class adenine-specific DNA methylase